MHARRIRATSLRLDVLDEDVPFCLVETGGKGIRITAISKAAAGHGVKVGQPLNDARAICPQLASYPADSRADMEGLKSLAQWCDRYSPSVSLIAPDSIAIDTTGCAHLFGGEAALLQDVMRRLQWMKLTVRTGLAETLAAARAIALFADINAIGDRIVPHGQIAAATNDLPVEALDLCFDIVVLLRRLGLKTIGAVAAVPRHALARRFQSKQAAGDVCLRLDHLYGRRGQAFQPLKPAPLYRARMGCNDPILDIVSLEYGLGYLLNDLVRQLEGDGVGVRTLTLTACRVDGSTRAVQAGLSRPNRNPSHLQRLLKERLEQIDPGEGIDTLILSADAVQVFDPRQKNLDGTSTLKSEETSVLIDRLANRLGAKNVYRTIPVESHIPERAQKPVAVNDRTVWLEHSIKPDRPFRLLARPETISAIAEVPDGPPLQFIWRRIIRRVVHARGPERIAPEWWLQGAADDEVRDYYEVEDTQGHRYWLYRAGLYQDPVRKGPPLWFMHGLFA